MNCNNGSSETPTNRLHHWDMRLRQDRDLDNLVNELQFDLLHLDCVYNALNMCVHDLLFL